MEKYPLTDEEINKIEAVWKFINLFNQQYVFLTDYRKHLIKTVQHKYTPEQFYELEMITNKLFWNLRWKLAPLWMDPEITEKEYLDNLHIFYKQSELPIALQLCSFEPYSNETDLENKIKHNELFEKTYYRSFINKLMIVDKQQKRIITKPFEGSSEIFSKNYFNLLTMTILFDRQLYDTIMLNPFLIKFKNIQLSKYYYQYDYGFPNLNFCTYLFGSKEDRLNRINKMYFVYEKPKSKYWYKLIK